MLHVLVSFLVLVIIILHGCALGFYTEPELYNYRIRTANYNLDDLSTDSDILIRTYDLENDGNVNVSDNCDGTVVYMELDHGKSLGKIYCKQGWYPDATSDAQQ